MIHPLLWAGTPLHLPGSYQQHKLKPAPSPHSAGPHSKPQEVHSSQAHFRALLPFPELHKPFLQGFQVCVILSHPSEPGSPFHTDGAVTGAEQ